MPGVILAGMAAETKTWMTPARLARGPEAAAAELRRWKMTARDVGFRPGRLTGKSVNMVRAEALAKKLSEGNRDDSYSGEKTPVDAAVARRARRPEAVGASFMFKDPSYAPRYNLVETVVVSIAAIGAGFLFGRWLRHRYSTVHGIGGEHQESVQVVGGYALGARF